MDAAKEALIIVRNLVQIGRVSTIDELNGTVQVIVEDLDNRISVDLQVMEWAGKPEVGQQVLCLFRGNGEGDGFCLGSFYSKENPPSWGGS